MVFESNISRGKISEFVKVICCDFSSIISSDFTCWRISRTLRPFQNLTLRVKQDSAVFNTEQWIVLDCVGLSTIRNVNQLRSELRIVLTDYSKDRKHIVCRFYAFMSGLLLLWEGRSLVIQQKAASVYPSVLNHCEMTKWVYTHIADRVKEKQFLPCDCSIFYLVLATREMNWLHHSIAESLRLCQHDVCEADTGFDCVSSVWIKWVPAVTLQLYRFCWPGVGCELSDPVRNLRWFRLKPMWTGCMLSGQIVILLSELIFGWREKKKGQAYMSFKMLPRHV